MSPMPVPRPVAIDTDPGIDDALALMLALRAPELRVELITTVAGNVPVEMATANARRLLALIAPPTWPVVAQGSARPLRRPLHTAVAFHGQDGLGGLTELRRPDGSPQYPLPQQPVARQHAVKRLLTLVETHRQDLTIIALGPLTNIARAILQAPDTMRQLGRLVIMGGAIGVPGNISAVAEFNIFVDPHAADIVFGTGLPITLVPLDVTRQVRLTRAFLAQTVHGAGNKLAQAIRQMTRQSLDDPQQTAGLAMHDPLAVAVALDPTLVRTTRLPVGVETQGQQTIGMTVADRRAPERWENSPPCIDVALEVDAPRMLALFADRVLATRGRAARSQRRLAGVVVVGSANTDLTVQAAHLPAQGETVLGKALHTAFGGKGANQAVAAHRAGARVFLLAKLGQDHYGQEYAHYLRHEGLDVSGLQWDPEVPSGVALITVDRRGHNQIAVAPGANSTLTPRELEGLEAHFTPGQVLLTQLETPLTTVETALRRAKAAGLTTILNPAPARQLLPRLTRVIDILIPNEIEAAMLCGHPVGTLQQARNAARLLSQAGYGTVIITLGKQGVVYTAAERIIHLPGFAVQARDTTAAGDTFVGYFACALAEGHTLSEALQLANAAAALAVTRIGAQSSMPYRQEVQQFLAARQRD